MKKNIPKHRGYRESSEQGENFKAAKAYIENKEDIISIT